MKFNKLIPELSVSNLEKSLRFYIEIVGFKIDYRRYESKFAMISFQGSQIMLEEINSNWTTGELKQPFGRGINFQIEIDKVKPILDKLKNSKYPIFVKSKENWYRQDDQLIGNKEFLVQDPDGYLLRFVENLGNKPHATSIL